MSPTIEQLTAAELPLTKEHPAYVAVMEEVRSLEAAGVSPDDEEYIALVTKFIADNRALAEAVAPEQPYLTALMNRIDGGERVETDPLLEVHAEAVPYAQHLLIGLEDLSQELLFRNRQGETEFIPNRALFQLGEVSSELLEGVRSGDAKNIAESLSGIAFILDQFGRETQPQSNDDERSLISVGQKLEDVRDAVRGVYRLYAEKDDQSTEARAITEELSRVSSLIEGKQDYLHRIISALREYHNRL